MNAREPRTANSGKTVGYFILYTRVINYGDALCRHLWCPLRRGVVGPFRLQHGTSAAAGMQDWLLRPKGCRRWVVAVAVLMEMKITDERYPHFTSGFKVLSSKAASQHQGGIALLWREGHPGVEVEAARIVTPNLLTLQHVTGDERFYCMGVYIPPNDTVGVEDLRSAWEACPDGCTPIILGDLNINFRDPRDEREEQIVDLLDEINMIDASRKFSPRRPCKLQNRARWTWRYKREGRMHYSQPDYIMAREGDVWQFWKFGFRWHWYHDSNHQAVVTTIRCGRVGWMKSYWKQCQRFPLQHPAGPLDELTTAFEKMKVECIEPAAKRRNCKDWVSDATCSRATSPQQS